MTGSNSPFSKISQHETKRQAILSEAARLFNTKGTRASTLIDIASKLDLTKTSLYYYVKTKEELVYLCYLASCKFHQEIIDHAKQNGTNAREKLEAIVREYFRRVLNARQGLEAQRAIMTEILTLKPAHRDEVTELYLGLFLQYRDLIADGVDDGSFEPCEPIATALAFFGNIQWTPRWTQNIPDEDFDLTVNEFIDIAMNGLASNSNFQPIHFPELESLKVNKSFDRDTQNQLKQEAFYKVGSQFFNSKGFKGTSLDEIAEALQVTKGAFYYHIKNKDDLLLNCFRRTLNYTRQMQELADQNGARGLDKLELAAHYLFYVQNSEAGPLIRYLLVKSLEGENQVRIIEEAQAVDDRFGEFIQLGMDDGSIRPVNSRIAEQFVSGAINSSVDLNILTSSRDVAKNSADFFQMIFHGLAAR